MTHHPSFMLLNARAPRHWALASILAITIGLLLSMSAPVLAGKIHVFASTFGAEGSGNGQFKEPSGIAVNEVTLGSTGNVYVVDEGNARVEIFSSEGEEVKGEFNGEETPAGSFSSPNAIAIDNSTDSLDPSAGDVYVVDSGNKVVDKFDPEGRYLGQIATGAGGEPLGEVFGVAVDPSGVVWIYQASREVDNYSNATANLFLASTETPFEEAGPGFAVDSEDGLYVNKGEAGAGLFAKISSAGQRLLGELGPERATAATVDLSNDFVYVDSGEGVAAFEVKEPVGCTPGEGSTQCVVPLEQFGESHLSSSHGIAIDSANGLVYASNREADTVTVFDTVHTPTAVTGEAASLTQSTAALNGTVDPEGVEVGSCTFEYGHNSEYGESVECEPQPGSGEGAVAVSANISGLEVGSYHFRLNANNENGESHGADHTFLITAKPTISSEALVSTTATSATIGARINPNGLDTSYQLEYGTSPSYGSSSPATSMGGGFSSAGVQVTLNGLSPGTTYHARVSASNERGSVQGVKDITFTTATVAGEASASSCPNRALSGFSPSLPDCRAYEDVSSEGGPGDVYTPTSPASVIIQEADVKTEAAMRAAAGGSGVAYVAEAGETGGSGASGRGLGNQFIATRATLGWQVQNITPHVADPEIIPQSPVYEAYSSDLSSGIFASDSPALAAEAAPRGPAGCQVLYDRNGDGAFHALFTETQTPGTCGTSTSAFGFSLQNLLFAGANEGSPSMAAGSHLVFQSPAPLVAGAQASEEEGEGNNLYESVGGMTRLVSVLPDGKADANAVFGASPARRQKFGVLLPPNSRPNFANVISDDGSRIFWTDLGSGKIYERVSGTSTFPVSEGQATYWGASADGHYVFYTEAEQLWRYDTQLATREALTAPGSGVQGVAGISGDGTYVYFVAGGALAAGAESRNCHEAGQEINEPTGVVSPEEQERLERERGEERRGHLPTGRGCNLYLSNGREIRLVAALAAQDDRLERETNAGNIFSGVWQVDRGSRTAQVANGGRELVFESTQQLTGYDNTILDEQRNSFEPGVEVFVYDAEAGRVVCASCDPSGAPPALEPNGGSTYLPVNSSPTFVHRWVSADGSKVFFDSSQPLAKQDTNQLQDVYEWERSGSGTCSAGSAGGGCIALLSGGDSSYLSYFIDASADGGDVFFTHRGQLNGIGASGANVGVFDARVEGGFPEFSTACTGTGCQGVPPASPAYATPPSATFNGGGNYSPSKQIPTKLSRARLLAKALKACARKKVKSKRTACEKQARKGYGPPVKAKGKQHKKAKKSSRRSSNGRKR